MSLMVIIIQDIFIFVNTFKTKISKIFLEDKKMRLKELREERNLTQSDVAVAVGTSQKNISRWENESNEPTASFLIMLANYFQCSIDFLLERSDDFGNITIHTEKPAPLPQDEQNLLDVYRKLDTVNKMHVSAYAEVRLEEQENRNPSTIRKK